MSRLHRALAAVALAGALIGGPSPVAGVASWPGRATAPAPAPAPSAALPVEGSIRFPGLGRSGATTLAGTIHDWGCRGGTIGTGIYRWGCAGDNNRYLVGHAYAAFAPLHDFVAARGAHAGPAALVGMPVYLRLASGEVLRYRVAWAGVWDVDTWGRSGDFWAWNATRAPSITLQTCSGPASEYRIVVRAVLVG
jgi:hypothetical protein